jgi:phytoene dehydrogenase-like protein
MPSQSILIVGAGINSLVAANYLQRAGHKVLMIERASKVGGACISDNAVIAGQAQNYALGASVLGLMQDFVFKDTGLAQRLKTFVPDHPKLIHIAGEDDPTWIYRNPVELDRELAAKWGERGKVEEFRADEAKVVEYLQLGYAAAKPPSIAEATEVLGQVLTDLWISGSARSLLDHYFTSERSKIYMAMTVTESGPVPLDDPYSAFTLPLMDSGSIFGGYYGFVKGGIWRITEVLGDINAELGVDIHVDSKVINVDSSSSVVTFEKSGREHTANYDYLILGTDPLTAAKLVGTDAELKKTGGQKFRGSSGKLNLMFRNPVQWKHGSNASDSDAAFRFIFDVDTLDDFEHAALAVADDGVDYVPGYMQIYCEGAAMRRLDHAEPYDRLAVFFKNFSLANNGAALPEIEEEAKRKVLAFVNNPEDCIWSRMLTPKDLQELFLFPGGNLDHTMLTGGQTFFDRNYSSDAENNFYRFGGLENVYLCGSGVYPCGSVTGTPGYMCSQQLMRQITTQ